MSEPILAWHFTSNRLRDGSPIPPIGTWLEFEGKLKMCVRGLHASVHPFDALKYAPGNTLHRVECAGEIIKDSDKMVCSRRKIVATRDAEKVLRKFACDQARLVTHLWQPPDIVVQYLTTRDEFLRAAAWDAACAAARAAAWAASRDASRTAARLQFEQQMLLLFDIGAGPSSAESFRHLDKC